MHVFLLQNYEFLLGVVLFLIGLMKNQALLKTQGVNSVHIK